MARSGLETCLRVAGATGGGYLAATSSLAIGTHGLVRLGMARVEAVTLGLMLVFIVYLCLALWFFAARTPWRPLGVFAILIVAGYGPTFFIGHGH